MAEVKITYDREGKTLTVWFEDASQESVCEETGEEVILIKNAAGCVIGFEKLNFSVDDPAGLRVALKRFHDSDKHLEALMETISLNLELEEKQKELAEANDRLIEIAITDQVTGLYNRHFLFSRGEKLWEESRNSGFQLTAVMMDIDDFKSVNDTYGHVFGDYVLRDISARMRKIARESDLLARYGGEELILVAPNTDLSNGIALAEQMRSSVVAAPFVTTDFSAKITISIGVAVTQPQELSFEMFLRSADRALYTAKRNGKNCVYVDPSLAVPSSTHVGEKHFF